MGILSGLFRTRDGPKNATSGSAIAAIPLGYTVEIQNGTLGATGKETVHVRGEQLHSAAGGNGADEGIGRKGALPETEAPYIEKRACRHVHSAAAHFPQFPGAEVEFAEDGIRPDILAGIEAAQQGGGIVAGNGIVYGQQYGIHALLQFLWAAVRLSGTQFD